MTNKKSRSGFTVVELLVVMAIILVLAGLILATSGYVQKKGARSRAEAEIAAISAACESYKADNGIYPTSTDTQALDPTNDVDPTISPPNKYTKASLTLYESLSGDTDGDRIVNSPAKTYLNFKPNMLAPPPPSAATVTAIRDPFGNSYGYSTLKATTPASTDGYNPTFDLWSTGGDTSSAQTQWIKNW